MTAEEFKKLAPTAIKLLTSNKKIPIRLENVTIKENGNVKL